MSYTIHDTQHDLQVCPNCGKQALAQPRENHYRCVWCGFESNVSDEAIRFPWFITLVILVALVIVLVQA